MEFEDKKKDVSGDQTNGQLWKLYTETNKYIVEALKNIYNILVIFWNGSDLNDEETLQIIYDGLGDLALRSLDIYLFPIEVDSNHVQHKVVKAFLGIIHNLCHKYDKCIPDLRLKDALRIVGMYRNTGTSTLKTKSILSCSYLLSEKDDVGASVIKLEESDINFLIKVLRDSLSSPNNHSKKYGYHADELITGLNNIAIVESNKNRLVNAGVLPLYVDAMSKAKPALQACAARAVWTLAFDEESMKRIKAEPKCMEGKYCHRTFTSALINCCTLRINFIFLTTIVSITLTTKAIAVSQ